ncbi:MAG: V-type ATP synthase subunit D [Acholeplasma sp.]|nr:V-type ATP synthase subunit D [Acholeplasma sp.]
MAKSQVNPTRMELIKLKKKLTMSTRGYKLLKDKQDELIHSFMGLVYETRDLRNKVDQLFADILSMFTKVKEKLALVDIYETLMIPSNSVSVTYKFQNVMTVEIPKIDIVNEKISDSQTYSDISTPIEVEDIKSKMGTILPLMIKLAEMEQSIYLMTEEIAKTRRRVNVIDNIMIPELKSEIKRITMKLEDNERSNTVRIMKSKEIVLEKIVKEREKRNS